MHASKIFHFLCSNKQLNTVCITNLPCNDLQFISLSFKKQIEKIFQYKQPLSIIKVYWTYFL